MCDNTLPDFVQEQSEQLSACFDDFE